MAVLPAAAAAAYKSAASMGVSATTAPGIAPANLGGGFSDFLTDAVKSSMQTMKTGESLAAQGAAGQANVLDVVNAVNSAELTLDTVVAVRDKVVQAYQSIMNMPI